MASLLDPNLDDAEALYVAEIAQMEKRKRRIRAHLEKPNRHCAICGSPIQEARFVHFNCAHDERDY